LLRSPSTPFYTHLDEGSKQTKLLKAMRCQILKKSLI
jgi:hypothetical protein